MNIHNPKRYRERCTPRPIEEARKACADFCEELDALVQKHGIQDLTVCGMANTIVPPSDLLDPDEKEAPIQFVMHIGDFLRSVEMAAYAHAYQRAAQDSYMQRLKARAEKDGQKP